jgi:hypothetical protein
VLSGSDLLTFWKSLWAPYLKYKRCSGLVNLDFRVRYFVSRMERLGQSK